MTLSSSNFRTPELPNFRTSPPLTAHCTVPAHCKLPTANCQLSPVQGTITNPIAKKVVGATDRMLLVTNAPWLFQDELVRITTTASSAFPVVCTGVTRD